jgi:hypothetical protein
MICSTPRGSFKLRDHIEVRSYYTHRSHLPILACTCPIHFIQCRNVGMQECRNLPKNIMRDTEIGERKVPKSDRGYLSQYPYSPITLKIVITSHRDVARAPQHHPLAARRREKGIYHGWCKSQRIRPDRSGLVLVHPPMDAPRPKYLIKHGHLARMRQTKSARIINYSLIVHCEACKEDATTDAPPSPSQQLVTLPNATAQKEPSRSSKSLSCLLRIVPQTLDQSIPWGNN